MAFHNVSLPNGLDYGSLVGPGFGTILRETASGHTFAIARQSQVRHRFRLRQGLRTQAQAVALKEFAIGRRGSLHTWKLSDLMDNTTNANGTTAPTALDQFIGTGDGTNRVFPLLKTYDQSGPAPYSRRLRHPVAGSVLASVNGTPTVAFTESNGDLTFATAPPAGQLVYAGCRFECRVRFMQSMDTWAAMQATAFERWSLDELDAIEDLDDSGWPELWYPGGSYDWGVRATDFATHFKYGKLQYVKVTAAISIYLPSLYRIPGGTELLAIYVDPTSTGTVQLRNVDGAAIGGLLTNGVVYKLGVVVTGGVSQWLRY